MVVNADGVGCGWCWMRMVKADASGMVDDSALDNVVFGLETFVRVCAATMHY